MVNSFLSMMTEGCEHEVDMVITAEHVRPQHIATMRNDAGGLLLSTDCK